MSIAALELGCRVTLIVVFLAAAYHKLQPRSFAGFVASLRDFGIPESLVGTPLAAAIVVVEVEVGMFALVAPTLGYALALVTLTGFTLGMLQVLRAGRRTACKCFGASATPIGRAHLIRNAFLFTAAALGLGVRLSSGPATIDRSVQLAGVAIGALCGLAVTHWDDLAFLIQPRRA